MTHQAVVVKTYSMYIDPHRSSPTTSTRIDSTRQLDREIPLTSNHRIAIIIHPLSLIPEQV